MLINIVAYSKFRERLTVIDTRQSLIRAILLLVSRLSPVISWSPELSAAVLRAHQPRPDVSALCALWRFLPRSRTEEMDNTLLTDMLVST